jgi:hypothetical protein
MSAFVFVAETIIQYKGNSDKNAAIHKNAYIHVLVNIFLVTSISHLYLNYSENSNKQ